MPANVLDFLDEDGKRYVFSEKNRQRHILKHPELREVNFPERIQKAITEPKCIYPAYGLKRKNKFCYYYYEFTLNGKPRYTKVVVLRTKSLYVIMTAWRDTKIKESKYFKELCQRP